LSLRWRFLRAGAARRNAEEVRHQFRVHPRLGTDIFVLPVNLPVEVIEEWKSSVDRRLWQLPPRIHWAA
jgi:hypothetical protein